MKFHVDFLVGHYLQQVDFDWLDEKPYKFYFDKMNIGNFLLTNHSHTKYIQNYSTGNTLLYCLVIKIIFSSFLRRIHWQA